MKQTSIADTSVPRDYKIPVLLLRKPLNMLNIPADWGSHVFSSYRNKASVNVRDKINVTHQISIILRLFTCSILDLGLWKMLMYWLEKIDGQYPLCNDPSSMFFC